MTRLNKTLMTVLLMLLSLGMMAGTVSAKNVDLSDNAFKFGKMKYWRGKAENIRLGSYGEKKTNGKYLAVEAHMKAKHFETKVEVAGPFKINFKDFNKKTLGRKIRYLKSGGSGALSWEKAKRGKLKLMKFFLTEKNIKSPLNKKANGALNYLINEGGDGRVVSEIWVVVEASFGEEIRKAGGFSANYSGKTLELRGRAKASSTHRNAIQLEPGTTFAYLMHKVKKWKKKKGKKVGIENMEDDQPGMR